MLENCFPGQLGQVHVQNVTAAFVFLHKKFI